MNKEELKEIYEIFKLVEQHKIKLPLLAVDEPIFGIVTYLDKTYKSVYYLLECVKLQHAQVTLFCKSGSFKKFIKELLIAKPDIENLDKVIDGEISIYDFFSESHKYRIGKIANKIFAPTVVRNMSEIPPKLVSEDLYLSLSEERKMYYKSCIHSRFERLKGYNNFKSIV